MNLDATTALLVVILAGFVRDGLLAWRLLGLLGERGGPFPPAPPVEPPVTPPVPPVVVPPVVDPPIVKPPVVVPPVVPPVVVPPVVPTGPVHKWVGKCSTFGGPNDTGSGNPSEGLALVSAADIPTFQDVLLPGAHGDALFRQLDPTSHYIACRWDYSETPKSYLKKLHIPVKNPRTGKIAADVRPVDWGPNARTGRVADLSPGLAAFLGVQTDDTVEVDIPLPAGGPTQPPTQPTDPVGSIVLHHNTWPTQAQVRAGILGDPHDTSQHVEVVCPWSLNNGKTKSITIHKMFAASLSRCLNYIWEHPTVNKSQAWIDGHGYNVFDGSWVIRPISGTSEPSMHAYAAAMDWNAAKNPQHAPESETLFKTEKTEPPHGSLIIWTFEQEGWTCGIRWSPAYIDAMHIQGPRV